MPTFEQAEQEVLKFRNERDWEQFHNPKDLAISICLEASELLERFQWSGEDCECIASAGGQVEELADVLIYCILLADRLGVDPADIVIEKTQQNSEKYPVDKARGSSSKYTSFNA